MKVHYSTHQNFNYRHYNKVIKKVKNFKNYNDENSYNCNFPNILFYSDFKLSKKLFSKTIPIFKITTY